MEHLSTFLLDQPAIANAAAAFTAGAYDAMAGDDESCRFVIDRKMLVVDRNVGGLTCRICLPAAFYDGVALVLGGREDDGIRSYAVRLMHRDPGLTMTISGLSGLGAAMDLRDDLARQLRLPAVAISCDGEISGDATKLGGIIACPQLDRRGSAATRRRPRFLARRKGGHGRTSPRLSGREIIARD
jgi:hypothetical protein